MTCSTKIENIQKALKCHILLLDIKQETMRPHYEGTMHTYMVQGKNQ